MGRALKRAALICGNGPSLAQIQYSAIPSEVDIFRCNQFYFESEYYTGSVLDHVFLNTCVSVHQLRTYDRLVANGEYTIKNLYYNLAPERMHFSLLHRYDSSSPITPSLAIIDTIKEISMYLAYLNAKHGFRITSGLNMLLTAIALGYREIFIAGIDLYKTKDMYAFDYCKPGLLNIAPGLRNADTFVDQQHRSWIDLECLRWACHYLNSPFLSDFESPLDKVAFAVSSNFGHIFCVGRHSPLSIFLPFAPDRRDDSLAGSERLISCKKMDTSTSDILYEAYSTTCTYNVYDAKTEKKNYFIVTLLHGTRVYRRKFLDSCLKLVKVAVKFVLRRMS